MTANPKPTPSSPQTPAPEKGKDKPTEPAAAVKKLSLGHVGGKQLAGHAMITFIGAATMFELELKHNVHAGMPYCVPLEKALRMVTRTPKEWQPFRPEDAKALEEFALTQEAGDRDD